MRVCIHRGTKEIGGSCIELECDGARILLDLGLPLDGDPDDTTRHPAIVGLDGRGSLQALILSHGHVDHFGLAPMAGPDLPVVLGAATLRILQAAAPFVPRPYVPAKTITFESGQRLTFGPFQVTPYLVDHSAFDAYALEVEAGGKRLFYSGDVRAHGRKAVLFERMLQHPPRNIDTMLLEGSTFGRIDPDKTFPHESEVEQQFADLIQATNGLMLVAASAQNIDRMVSLYRACKRTGRTLLIDLYAAEILRATGNPNIPKSNWPNVTVYIPQYQRRQIKQSGRFELLEPHRGQRIFVEHLKELAPRAVMLFRPAMLRDLDEARALDGARAVWSQWDGYLSQERGQALVAELAARSIPLSHAHTSGHASIRDLQRLAEAIDPRVLIPIHTFAPDQFPAHFQNVQLKNDGEWWEI